MKINPRETNRLVSVATVTVALTTSAVSRSDGNNEASKTQNRSTPRSIFGLVVSSSGQMSYGYGAGGGVSELGSTRVRRDRENEVASGIRNN